MTTLLGIIIFLFVLAYGHKEYTQLKTGISPQATSNAVRAALVGFIRENTMEHEAILDASSGWGGNLYFLARNLPRRNITGIEFSLVPWLVCNFRSFANRDVITDMHLIKTDIFKADLRQYSIVFCNFPAKVLNSLSAKIRREVSDSSYLISLNTPIKGWETHKVIQVSDPGKNRLYIYKGTASASSATAASQDTGQAYHQQTVKISSSSLPPVSVLGHRGFGRTSPYNDDPVHITEERRMQLPENSYEACLKALQSGANGIEIDVIMSKDGELMVCRDNDLSIHMTPDNLLKYGAIKISEQPYSVLKSVPVGFGGYKLATLDEMLFLSVKYNAIINIELKGKNTAQPVLHRIHTFVAEKSLNKNNIVISSFDHSQLKTIYDTDSEIKTSLMFIGHDTTVSPIFPDEPGSPYFQHFSPEYLDKIYPQINPFSVHVPSDMQDDNLFAVIEKYGMNCFVYPSDEPEPYENTAFVAMLYNMRRRGSPVHMITNYPEELSAILNDDTLASKPEKTVSS